VYFPLTSDKNSGAAWRGGRDRDEKLIYTGPVFAESSAVPRVEYCAFLGLGRACGPRRASSARGVTLSISKLARAATHCVDLTSGGSLRTLLALVVQQIHPRIWRFALGNSRWLHWPSGRLRFPISQPLYLCCAGVGHQHEADEAILLFGSGDDGVSKNSDGFLPFTGLSLDGDYACVHELFSF
jgi:hypothetical protein